mmetsp:Transcript_125070/g.365293  ORF Transcript_125070/g.365293 Transcript_125070/m.365293 type:complete len:188 (+) Transcript_125070:51-614(+)
MAPAARSAATSRSGSRRPVLAAALLLAAAGWTAAAFLPPALSAQRPVEQRREALARALAVAAAAPLLGGQSAEAGGARWSGRYDDPKFPGCERRITKDGDIFIISGTTSTDGSKKCEEGKPTKRWSITAAQPEGSFGPSDTLNVDFSNKGGPTNVEAKWAGDGIMFPGGNKWTKKIAKPGATGLVFE